MQYVFLSTLNNFFKRTDNKNANAFNFLLAVLNKYILNVCIYTFTYTWCIEIWQQKGSQENFISLFPFLTILIGFLKVDVEGESG